MAVEEKRYRLSVYETKKKDGKMEDELLTVFTVSGYDNAVTAAANVIKQAGEQVVRITRTTKYYTIEGQHVWVGFNL